MARRSSIEDLPKEARERLGELIRDGWTLDEMTKVLKDMGAQVSRSAVGRYVQRESMAMLRYQEAQAVARVWVDKVEAEPDGDVARLLPQMLSAVAFQTIDAMSDAEDGAGALEVGQMAKAIKDLSSAKVNQAALELKMREVRNKAREELLAEQRKALDAAEKKNGVTVETRQAIRDLLGIG